MFLEKDELVRLTGYVQANKQKAVLEAMGVAFKIRETDNVMLVLKDDVVGMFRSLKQQSRPVADTAPVRDHEPEVLDTAALSGFV